MRKSDIVDRAVVNIPQVSTFRKYPGIIHGLAAEFPCPYQKWFSVRSKMSPRRNLAQREFSPPKQLSIGHE